MHFCTTGARATELGGFLPIARANQFRLARGSGFDPRYQIQKVERTVYESEGEEPRFVTYAGFFSSDWKKSKNYFTKLLYTFRRVKIKLSAEKYYKIIPWKYCVIGWWGRINHSNFSEYIQFLGPKLKVLQKENSINRKKRVIYLMRVVTKIHIFIPF